MFTPIWYTLSDISNFEFKKMQSKTVICPECYMDIVLGFFLLR